MIIVMNLSETLLTLFFSIDYRSYPCLLILTNLKTLNQSIRVSNLDIWIGARSERNREVAAEEKLRPLGEVCQNLFIYTGNSILHMNTFETHRLSISKGENMRFEN